MNVYSGASLWDQKEASLQPRPHSCLDFCSLPHAASLSSSINYLNKNLCLHSVSREPSLQQEPYRPEKWDWEGRMGWARGRHGEGGRCVRHGLRWGWEELRAPLNSVVSGPAVMRPFSPSPHWTPYPSGTPSVGGTRGHTQGMGTGIPGQQCAASPDSSSPPFLIPRGTCHCSFLHVTPLELFIDTQKNMCLYLGVPPKKKESVSEATPSRLPPIRHLLRLHHRLIQNTNEKPTSKGNVQIWTVHYNHLIFL